MNVTSVWNQIHIAIYAFNITQGKFKFATNMGNTAQKDRKRSGLQVDISPCHLCAQIMGDAQNDLISKTLNEDEYQQRVAMETESFVVIPSLGPLAEGHMLLCTRGHLASFAEIPKKCYDDYNDARASLKACLEQHYEASIWIFEHGMGLFGGRQLCTVDHAHMHFVPLPKDFKLKNRFLQNWISFDGTIANMKLRSNGQEYLYLQTPDGHFMSDVDSTIPSQYLRKIIAEGQGNHDWNWREHLKPMLAAKAFSALYST